MLTAAALLSVVLAASPATTPDFSGVLRLVGGRSLAHACPVGATTALTSAHVLLLRWGGDSYPSRWSDGTGLSGRMVRESLDTSSDADLGTFESDRKFVRWYKVAENPPKPGEHLWIKGYDIRKQDQGLADRVWEIEVLRIVAAHVVFKPSVDAGTSGSCVLNEHSEVVAVISWGLPLNDGKEVGVAPGIWGEWLPGLQAEKAEKSDPEQP